MHLAPDGRPKGSGIVLFESIGDAQNAMQSLQGVDFQGRSIEIREDRYANAGGMRGGGFRGGSDFRGGSYRGGLQSGRPPFRGGYEGGRGGVYHDGGGFGRGSSGGGRDYYDNQQSHAPVAPPNPFTDGATGNGEPSATIHVRNLPWSTSNDDLVELFSTIGKVEKAEIQYEAGGRSKGSGVVQFDSSDSAQLSISNVSSCTVID